ncbi:MAG TPA: hypothetical protein VGL24_03570 [Chthoniobacterales bacterium]|jgi:hypothetical protein
MKTNPLSRPIFIALALTVAFSLGSAPLVRAQGEAAGIQQSMTPEEFKAAGLEKLSPAELAKLNLWLQGYREKAVAKAEKKATERAARDKQSLIVSRINGTWGGITPGVVIELEDGSKWKLANKDEHYGGYADHPAVAVWKAGMFGWKMRVSRIAEFYVNPVK